LDQKKYAEAEPFARGCPAIRAKNKPDGWATLFTQFMVGTSLVGQKKYADAEPFLVQGYEGLKERVAKMPLADKDELKRLAQLHDSCSLPEKAFLWRMKLDKPGATSAKPRYHVVAGPPATFLLSLHPRCATHHAYVLKAWVHDPVAVATAALIVQAPNRKRLPERNIRR
jgi:hypothetical protein